jgi:hypothetical protein
MDGADLCEMFSVVTHVFDAHGFLQQLSHVFEAIYLRNKAREMQI